MTSIKTSEMTKVALGTTLIVVFSQISIPMPYGVPVTLQTFIIPLVAFILGRRLGVISSIIYILLGLIGLPVFSGMSGTAALLGPTAGFILSFPLLAYFSGWASLGKSIFRRYICLCTGMILNFFIGWLVFQLVTGSSGLVAFNAAVLPFIPTTMIKIICIDLAGEKLSHVAKLKVS